MTTITIETIANDFAPLTAEDLRWAAAVAQQLVNRGIELQTAYHNGRRMVLNLDRNPNLENAQIAMIRRESVNGGAMRIFATTHLGVQLQWSVFEPAAREVCHG